MTIRTTSGRMSQTKSAVHSKQIAWRGFQETAYRAIQGCKRAKGCRIDNDETCYSGAPSHLSTQAGALRKATGSALTLVTPQAGEAEHQLNKVHSEQDPQYSELYRHVLHRIGELFLLPDSSPTATALATIKFTDYCLALACPLALNAVQVKLHRQRWKFADIFEEHDCDYDFDNEYWQEEMSPIDQGMLKAREVKNAEKKEKDFLDGIPRGWGGRSKLRIVDMPDDHA